MNIFFTHIFQHHRIIHKPIGQDQPPHPSPALPSLFLPPPRRDAVQPARAAPPEGPHGPSRQLPPRLFLRSVGPLPRGRLVWWVFGSPATPPPRGDTPEPFWVPPTGFTRSLRPPAPLRPPHVPEVCPESRKAVVCTRSALVIFLYRRYCKIGEITIFPKRLIPPLIFGM